jgi:methanogenic corrinoid protein MtbC1
MFKQGILNALKDCIVNFDMEGIKKYVREALEKGIPPHQILMEGMAKGLEIVGQKYQQGEYFLPELVMAGETMKEGMKMLTPYLKELEIKRLGKVVIGTVEGGSSRHWQEHCCSHA